MGRYLVFLLIVGLLGGCLLKPWIPAAGQYAVEDRFAIVRSDSLTVFVRPQTYSGDAAEVADDYFCLYVRVRNESRRPIAIGRGNFNLLTPQRQYDHIPLQVVLGNIQNALFFSQISDPFTDTPFATELTDAEQAREQYLELVNSYFSFGDLLPGGVKEGYLFYDERVERVGEFTLDVLGVPVTFIR